MNYLQFGLFGVFVFSVLISGIRIYGFINKDNRSFLSRYIYLGEALLLGSIYLIGLLLLLSMLGLYKAPFLWLAVIANYLFILNRETRKNLSALLLRRVNINPAVMAFCVILAVFVFRNMYFLVDVDSNSTYLFTQRLWLLKSTSLAGSAKDTFIIFLPQFDAIPYSLGLSILGQETFFPCLINLFWRMIVVLLLFGYAGYRFNKYYGLAAVMFTLFNDHFFYSGVNHWVLINGAVIALLFASTYNFWEASRKSDAFRFALALIFLSQLIANKYQMVYVAVFILALGALIQPDLKNKIKKLFFNRRLLCVLIAAFAALSLWFMKNLIVTGDPLFPGLAGRLKAFDWTIEQQDVFMKVFGGITPLTFLKYMNYLFIWPGIAAAKFVILTISFLPIILLTRIKRFNSIEKDRLKELSFWLGVSLLVIMGICLTSHQDSRYYRYAIAILSFTAVVSLSYLLEDCLGIKKRFFIGAMMLLIAFKGGANEGYKVIFQSKGPFMLPTFAENREVILDKMHTKDAVGRHYPQVADVKLVLDKNRSKLEESAWDMSSFNINIPQFLLPVLPVASMWYSTLIKWDSYSSSELILKDLKENHIEWIIALRGKEWIFIPAKDYALEAVSYNRYPEHKFYGYHCVPELNAVNYGH
jgi:hypothetical protein